LKYGLIDWAFREAELKEFAFKYDFRKPSLRSKIVGPSPRKTFKLCKLCSTTKAREFTCHPKCQNFSKTAKFSLSLFDVRAGNLKYALKLKVQASMNQLHAIKNSIIYHKFSFFKVSNCEDNIERFWIQQL